MSGEDRLLTVPNALSVGRLLCVPLFLGSHAQHLGWQPVAGFLAWVAVIPALILSYYAAFTYIPLGRIALAEGRVGAHA